MVAVQLYKNKALSVGVKIYLASKSPRRSERRSGLGPTNPDYSPKRSVVGYASQEAQSLRSFLTPSGADVRPKDFAALRATHFVEPHFKCCTLKWATKVEINKLYI